MGCNSGNRKQFLFQGQSWYRVCRCSLHSALACWWRLWEKKGGVVLRKWPRTMTGSHLRIFARRFFKVLYFQGGALLLHTRTNLVISSSDLRKIIRARSNQNKLKALTKSFSTNQFVLENSKYFKSYHGKTKIFKKKICPSSKSSLFRHHVITS